MKLHQGTHTLHQGLVLHPSCVPEKVCVNNKRYSIRKKGLKYMEINHPNSIKLKMRRHKLEGGVKGKGHKIRSWCISFTVITG